MTAKKNTAEVIIAGKVLKISGYESAEYLHQIAVYINEKVAEFQKLEGYRRQHTDEKQIMLHMNLADDFFKAKRQADKLSAELEKKEREMYGLRHELIEARMKLEEAEKEQRELAREKEALQKEFAREKEALQKEFAKEKEALQKGFAKEKEALQKGFAKEKETLQKEIQELQKHPARNNYR